jgi:hypothetical protein
MLVESLPVSESSEEGLWRAGGVSLALVLKSDVVLIGQGLPFVVYFRTKGCGKQYRCEVLGINETEELLVRTRAGITIIPWCDVVHFEAMRALLHQKICERAIRPITNKNGKYEVLTEIPK